MIELNYKTQILLENLFDKWYNVVRVTMRACGIHMSTKRCFSRVMSVFRKRLCARAHAQVLAVWTGAIVRKAQRVFERERRVYSVT